MATADGHHTRTSKRLALAIWLTLVVGFLGSLIAPWYIWWEAILARVDVFVVLAGLLVYVVWTTCRYGWRVARYINDLPERRER